MIAGILIVITFFYFLRASLVDPTRPVGKPSVDVNVLSSNTDGPVEVLRSMDPIKTAVLRAKLESFGISADIFGEHTSRMLGHLLADVPLRLVVPRSELDRAIAILTERSDAEGGSEEQT